MGDIDNAEGDNKGEDSDDSEGLSLDLLSIVPIGEAGTFLESLEDRDEGEGEATLRVTGEDSVDCSLNSTP